MAVTSQKSSTLLARALGVASLGLGASELISPGGVARLSGVAITPRRRRVIRALGARECGHGAAILASSPRLVWTRVVGDALDVALLVRGLRSAGANHRRGAAALGFLAVVGAADAYAALDQLR